MHTRENRICSGTFKQLGMTGTIEQKGNKQEVELAEVGPSRILSAKCYEVEHYFIVPSCQVSKLRHRG